MGRWLNQRRLVCQPLSKAQQLSGGRAALACSRAALESAPEPSHSPANALQQGRAVSVSFQQQRRPRTSSPRSYRRHLFAAPIRLLIGRDCTQFNRSRGSAHLRARRSQAHCAVAYSPNAPISRPKTPISPGRRAHTIFAIVTQRQSTLPDLLLAARPLGFSSLSPAATLVSSGSAYSTHLSVAPRHSRSAGHTEDKRPIRLTATGRKSRLRPLTRRAGQPPFHRQKKVAPSSADLRARACFAISGAHPASPAPFRNGPASWCEFRLAGDKHIRVDRLQPAQSAVQHRPQGPHVRHAHRPCCRRRSHRRRQSVRPIAENVRDPNAPPKQAAGVVARRARGKGPARRGHVAALPFQRDLPARERAHGEHDVADDGNDTEAQRSPKPTGFHFHAN